MAESTIFYSWQSDKKETHSFIEKCLKGAIKLLSKQESKIEHRPTLDDSTKGKLGAVDIVATISEKIDNCDIFIADVSLIGECEKRKLVNQNVMYELGYMIGKHGDNRVIMLFNSDYGEIKDLPFDISHRRILPFSIKNDPKGESLKSTLVNLLSAYIDNANLIKQLPKNQKIDIDDEEMQILKLYATMENDKRIIISKTMNGYIINTLGKCDDVLLNKLIEQQGEQKIVANLDDLAKKGALKLSISSKGTPNYELAKLGFTAIETINNSEK